MFAKMNRCPRCGEDKIRMQLDQAWFEEMEDEYWIPAECPKCGKELNVVLKYAYSWDPDSGEEMAWAGGSLGIAEPDYESMLEDRKESTILWHS